MEDVDTKEKLKPLFAGKTEAEIDKAVKDLKVILDQAAEEVKGDMDISIGPLTVEKGKVIVDSVKVSDPIQKTKVPIAVNPLRKGEFTPTRKEILAQDMLSKIVSGELTPVEASKDMLAKRDVEEIKPLIRPITKAKREEPSHNLRDLECYDTLPKTLDRDSILLNKGPILQLGAKVWEEKNGPILDQICEQYEVAKNMKSIKSKSKWNGRFRKWKLPKKIKFRTDKEEHMLHVATEDRLMHAGRLDNVSLQKLNDFIAEKRKWARKESFREEVPVLYAKTL